MSRRLVASTAVRLWVTGSPGAQRLLFVLAIGAASGLESVGRIGAELALASFVVLFASGGISIQLLAEWSVATSGNQRRSLLTFAVGWLLLALVGGAITAIGAYEAGFIKAPWAVVAFATGSATWQVARVLLIARRSEPILAVVEVLLVAAFALLPFAWDESIPSAVVAIGLVQLSLAAGVWLWVFIPLARCGTGESVRSYLNEALLMGTNNLVSGGRDALIPFVVAQVSGDLVTGVVAQASACASALLLVPRAMAYSYIPRLALAYGAGDLSELGSGYRSYSRSIAVVCAASLLLLSMAIAVGMASGVLRLDGSLVGLWLLASASVLAGQLALAPSNLLTTLRRSGPIVTSAAIAFLVWLSSVLAGGVLVPGAVHFALLVMASTLTLAIIRSLWLARYTTKLVKALMP